MTQNFVHVCIVLSLVFTTLCRGAGSINAGSVLNGKVICVDPGHGATAQTDSFRVGPSGEREEWINLRVALYLREMLEASGARVLMTRRADVPVPLIDRAAAAVENKADLFLSIHHNATADSSTNFPVVYFHGNASENIAGMELGKCIARSVSKIMFGNETKTSLVSDHTIFPEAGAGVLRNSYGIPGVIGEASFFSNSDEEMRLKDTSYNKLEAKAYYAALVEFFSQQPFAIKEKYSLTKLPPFHAYQEADRMNDTAKQWQAVYRKAKDKFEEGTASSLNEAYHLFSVCAKSFPDSYVAGECHAYLSRITEASDPVFSNEEKKRVSEYYVMDGGDTTYSLAVTVQPFAPPSELIKSITAEKLRSHIAVLAHDSLEGRAPSSRGDRKAAAYIASQFKKFGLKPAGDHDTYIQTVPLVGVTVDPATVLTVSNGRRSLPLVYSTDFVATTGTYEPSVDLKNAEMVFVGYGIVAPEQQWDDYKDVDVRGKILVMVNSDPSTGGPDLFAGKGRTYYGRWTYKFEIAAVKGALGAIVIHTTASAGYRYEVIRNTWSRETYDLDEQSSGNRLALKAWTTEDATRAYLALAGFPMDSLFALAESRTFRPLALGITLNGTLRSTVQRLQTSNIIGMVEGSDPKLRDQYILFTAHHDHFGIGRAIEGDSIYNGALDNASGTSLMMNLAEAFSAAPTKPKRSLLFAAVAGEEQGLLGSHYLAEHPPVPLAGIAANLNTDVLNVIGRTTDISCQGSDRSSLGEDLAIVTKEMGMTVIPDRAPEQGGFYRSDHFSFAKVGVPAMSVGSGGSFTGVDTAFVRMMRERGGKSYHQPSDELYDDWNYDGALQQAEVAIRIAWRVANSAGMPHWNSRSEFAAARTSK